MIVERTPIIQMYFTSSAMIFSSVSALDTIYGAQNNNYYLNYEIYIHVLQQLEGQDFPPADPAHYWTHTVVT